MKTRCLIIDDEPLAIKLLEKHINQLESFEIVATAPNAIKGLEILKTNDIDLMFCDIKMPILTGIELLKTLKNPPKTIITTAHREYAIEGYELDIVDYLLKPITFERFFKAIEKFLRNNQMKTVSLHTQSLPFKLTIKSNNKYYKINIDEILYLESQKDYIKFVLKEQEITTKHKISEIENALTNHGFLRIHRSYIINQKHLHSFTATHIETGKYTIPIGHSYKELVMSKIKHLD
jgi:two-component system, LytTR family, response regulator